MGQPMCLPRNPYIKQCMDTDVLLLYYTSLDASDPLAGRSAFYIYMSNSQLQRTGDALNLRYNTYLLSCFERHHVQMLDLYSALHSTCTRPLILTADLAV